MFSSSIWGVGSNLGIWWKNWSSYRKQTGIWSMIPILLVLGQSQAVSSEINLEDCNHEQISRLNPHLLLGNWNSLPVYELCFHWKARVTAKWCHFRSHLGPSKYFPNLRFSQSFPVNFPIVLVNPLIEFFKYHHKPMLVDVPISSSSNHIKSP